MKRTIKMILVACLLTILSACGPTVVPYHKMGDLHLTAKNYPRTAEPNNLAFAYAEPVLQIDLEISEELKNGLKERVDYLGQSVKCHLNSELYKIILAKGFTITGRYKSYRYMSFTEKRNTTALFYPEITIKITERSDIQHEGDMEFSTSGSLDITANVNIVMLEPLSKEIIWIKSIPVNEISDSFQYKNAFWAGAYGTQLIRNVTKYKVGRGQKHDVPENLSELAEKIDKVFTEVDRRIIEATRRFVEPDEFTFLNTDIKKLKKIKRY